MYKLTRLLGAALLWSAVALPGFTQQNPAGLEIMTQVYDRPQPDDTKGLLTMTLENSRGAQRVRSVQQTVAKFGEAEKKLLFFIAPADVRDTAFMNWSYDNPATPDEQWIYLPALRQVRRISAEKKNDSFMGSDFSYEDLSVRHPGLDTHRLLRTETIDGHKVYVVESVPAAGTSAYGRTVSWVADGIWMGLKREYYAQSGELLKTLEIDEYRQIGGFWTITRMTMTNQKSRHSTIMELSDLRFDTGVAENTFSERTMTRGIR